MASDLDIFRSAHVIVKRHGEDAPIHAAMRADHRPDFSATLTTMAFDHSSLR